MSCTDCGRPLYPSAARSGNKRCPPCAKTWRASARCVTCNADLSHRRAAKYCSVRCCDVDRGVVLAEPLSARACVLPDCGQEFQPRKSSQRTCTEAHGKKLWNRENPEEWNDRRRDNYHRRRATRQQAATGRPVRLSEIRVRDNHRCHICREPVPDTPYPHPLSASLDHVVPLSRGGIHDPDNVRLAHLKCNVEKGADEGPTYDAEQGTYRSAIPATA